MYHGGGGGGGFSRGGGGGRGRGRGRGRGGGGGPPRGLRGKDIGLFYARKQKDRQAENRSLLTLTEVQKRDLQERAYRLDRMGPFIRDSDHVISSLRRNIANNERSEARAAMAETKVESKGRAVEEEEVEDWWDEAMREQEEKEEEEEKAGHEEMEVKEEVVQEGKSADELVRPRLGEKMRQELEEARKGRQYQKMLEFRKKLPAFKMREELVRLIGSSQVVVISGETGCGKTTQVPQFVLDDLIDRGEGHGTRVICTQPRRISAISIAERVAEERGERCGDGQRSSVGYQIRLESRYIVRVE